MSNPKAMALHYRKLGEQGPPLLILHGIFGSSDNWLSIAKPLATTHQVYLLDLRNHGQSPWDDAFDYSCMAEDLWKFILDHGLREVRLLGHSMGGKVVMQFDLLYPGIASKLFVVDIAPKYYPVHHHSILEGLNSLDLEHLESRSAANEHLKRFEEKEGVRQFLLKNLYRKEDNRFALRINLKVITQKIEVVGHELLVPAPSVTPCLFIKGGESPYILKEDESHILSLFPKASFLSIPGAGHWVQADQPEEFLAALLSQL